jgi:hypothetical protein
MTGELKHIGVPRRSGRYPWGSGKDPEQRNTSWLGMVNRLHEQGLNDTEIAKGMNISRTELQAKRAEEKHKKDLADRALATRLKDKGLSPTAIGRRMNVNESSVRGMLDPVLQERKDKLFNTAERLKARVDEVDYLDIGLGTEHHVGIARTKFDLAIALLKEQGYQTKEIQERQMTGSANHYTIRKLLISPDKPIDEYIDSSKIKLFKDRTEDGGTTWKKPPPAVSIDSKRIKVIYKEGEDSTLDGQIELRRGVEDLSLGGKNYAQVRIAVDGTHFMKGMAIYNDNMPDGYDVVYNTSKKPGATKDKIFKPMERVDSTGRKVKPEDPNYATAKIDIDDPFGSGTTKREYKGKDGKMHQSPIEVIGTGDHPSEEGEWGDWSRSISSQVLSKQKDVLAKKQLGVDFDIRKDEFDEIKAITNPAVKKILLSSFAEKTDTASVDLKAAAMPRQVSCVLIGIKSLKENEVHAPNFKDGERVVLIRHPHGGIFEIPELIVNNNNKEAISVIGKRAEDAVGINPKVATKLSGADFDGDTVLVISNNNREFRTSPPLKALMKFEPKEEYKGYPGMVRMSERTKQLEMGKVSNLITDMTIKGATPDKIARAVRHSMVVIDAEKHGLDWKRSEIDNNIADLKKEYQGGAKRGAATLISKAGSEERVPHRLDYIIDPRTSYIDPETGKLKGRRISIDPDTGKKLYTPTGKTYLKVPVLKDPITKQPILDPVTGKKIYLTEKAKVMPVKIISTKMAEKDNANELSSGTKIETIYAEHANKLKDLANKARLELINTPSVISSRSAKETYADEVKKLDAKLVIAEYNKPYERDAQALAAKLVSLKKQAHPDMEGAELKKVRGQAIIEARHRVGADKISIEITDREWEAIQAGAISDNKLNKILLNADIEKVKQRALPREFKGMSPSRLARARSMERSNCTTAEIAMVLGVSTSTVLEALR